jgi:hypothetical protein
MRCEGAPKERRAFASFNMNFLRFVESIRYKSMGNYHAADRNTPSTFLTISKDRCGRLNRELLTLLKLPVSLAGWNGVNAGRRRLSLV